MRNILKHKGYMARVEFDPDDRIFVGRVAGIEDGIGFHSDSVEGLISAFEEAVDDYVEACERIDKTPEKPFSGVVYLRVDPELHAKAAVAAEIAGKSLNQFGEEALRKATDQLVPV